MENSGFLSKQWIKEATVEIIGSFIFVFLYFLSIEHAIGAFSAFEIVLGSVAYGVIFFTIVLFLSEIASVHILPIVSFIELLKTDHVTNFFSRITAQLIGAIVATVFHIWIIRFGSDANFNDYAEPLDPFFTGLFTGFLSQAIYLLYTFIWRWQKDRLARYFLLSVGLGALYALVTVIGSITLLNPFGLLTHYLIIGNPITLKLIVTGGIVHVLTPMLFIAGTHYFLKGFIFKAKI